MRGEPSRSRTSPQGLCFWARVHQAFPWVPLSPLQARAPTQPKTAHTSPRLPRRLPAVPGREVVICLTGPSLLPLQAVTAGVMCGLAVLLEKPSRRIELALYTTTQALRAAPRGGKLGEKVLDRAVVPAFALALGTVMHHYVRHPETIRPSYLVRAARTDGTCS